MDPRSESDGWRDRRSCERFYDDSALQVEGFLESGIPFDVSGTIRDISVGGISFFLTLRLERDQELLLTLSSNQFEDLIFRVRARILRVFPSGTLSQPYLVAAQFQGDFMQTGGQNLTERIARALEEAVSFDEAARHQAPSPLDLCPICAVCGVQLKTRNTCESSEQVLCSECRCRAELQAWEAEIPSLLRDLSA